MRALFKLAASGVPLPLASIDNRRDLLAVESLADLIGLCIETPPRDKRTLVACDGERVSSGELYVRISAALGRQARLFAFPPAGLRAMGYLSGRHALVDSLVSSLEIDDKETRRQLGWTPRCDMRSAFEATARWFRDQDGSAGA
jgi:nucleoside-diphosphate-sugar epimerase